MVVWNIKEMCDDFFNCFWPELQVSYMSESTFISFDAVEVLVVEVAVWSHVFNKMFTSNI